MNWSEPNFKYILVLLFIISSLQKGTICFVHDILDEKILAILFVSSAVGRAMYCSTSKLRGHLWDRDKWSYKTGDLIKEVQFIWSFPWQDKKRWPFNTGDCLIEVTSWYYIIIRNIKHRKSTVFITISCFLFPWHKDPLLASSHPSGCKNPWIW
jgi:hypothetical protein